MPRPTRLNLAGIPQHVTQRGNNRQACFFADADYESLFVATDRGLQQAPMCRSYLCAHDQPCLLVNHPGNTHWCITGFSRPADILAIERLFYSYYKPHIRT
jgi:hypothetical protein